jgi:hypothetical protein
MEYERFVSVADRAESGLTYRWAAQHIAACVLMV